MLQIVSLLEKPNVERLNEYETSVQLFQGVQIQYFLIMWENTLRDNISGEKERETMWEKSRTVTLKMDPSSSFIK
jgi:hypothetical protein